MANTVIQLKYAVSTATPTSLQLGEAAYSNSAGKLYIGANSNGTAGIYTIGGSYYTDLVDAAASANTANTIVKRNTAGIFSATAIYASLFGNANTASTWATARTIGVSGDANGTVAIDGSANANIPLTLGDSGVTAGGYGSVTQIPTFSVDSKGRITAAANVSISTSLTVNGDTGTNVITLGTDTLTFVGGDGITTSISPTDNVRFDVDNTVVRTTGGTISGDLAITGNLTITGTTTTVNTSTVTTTDSLIKLAANNVVGDVLDIGFYGQANTGTSVTYHGLVRQAAGDFFLFKGLVTDPTSNTLATGSLTAANTATIRANLTGGTVSNLASAIAVADGGTGATTLTIGGIIMGNGTGALSVLANSSYTLTGALQANNTVTALTVDAYGRVTAATGAAISGLTVAQGGTGFSSYTANGVIFGGVTSTSPLTSVASSTEGHVLQISASGLPSFAHLNGGTF